MRQRSATWMRLAVRGNFRMESKAIINGVEYNAISAPIINRALISDNLSVGNCISATLKMSVLTDDKIGKSAEVVIKARITDDIEYSEWLEFGTFYIDTRTVDSGLVSMQCYDSMLKASQQYGDETNPEDRIGWPKTMRACVEEIAERIGVEIDPRTVIKTTAPYQVPYPNKLSMMQVLGYIGACHGGNWIITPENKLRLVPLLSPPAETFNIIDHDYNPIYTGDGHKLIWQHTETEETVEHKAGGGLINVPIVVGKIATSRAFTVSRVIIARDEELGYALGDDTGYTLIIESNPYACQAICDDLYAELNGLEYNPYTITSACYDPATELGDWILVGDKVRSVLYSENATLNVDYRVSASAPGKDEVGSEYPYLTSIQRLQKENEQIKKYTETEKDEIYSKIEQTHTEILLQVAGTFATKESVSSSIKLTQDAIAAEVKRATEAETEIASRVKLTEDAITAEVTRSTKADTELSSSVSVALEKIELKVSKGDVSSQISVESGQVTIGANRLVVESDNFTLSGTGEVSAKGTLSSVTDSYKTSVTGGGLFFYVHDSETASVQGATDFNLNNEGTRSEKVLAMQTVESAIVTKSGVSDEWSYNNLGYVLNNGLNPGGNTEKNLFFGDVAINAYDGLHTNVVYLRREGKSPATLIFAAKGEAPGASLEGFLSVEGDFECYGSKNRLVDTDNYDTIKMNAMESASAVFSDMGSGVLDDTGKVYVYLDPRFMEVIDRTFEYQVFITNTSEAGVSYVKKSADHFIAYGDPLATFDWIVYARQKDYAQTYMERHEAREVYVNETDESVAYGDNIGADVSIAYAAEFVDTYDEQAETYLKNYELEVTNYGN